MPRGLPLTSGHVSKLLTAGELWEVYVCRVARNGADTPLNLHWTTFDLNDQLLVEWQHDIAAAAAGADSGSSRGRRSSPMKLRP
jgi:hypothetical protein